MLVSLAVTMVTPMALYRVVEGSEWGMWGTRGWRRASLHVTQAQRGAAASSNQHERCGRWFELARSPASTAVTLTGRLCVCHMTPLPCTPTKRPAAVTMVTRLALRWEREADSPNCGYTWCLVQKSTKFSILLLEKHVYEDAECRSFFFKEINNTILVSWWQ